MTSIEISQNLRPLKIAYAIKPGDFVSLERIISLNSFLWGARYNPILPLYKQMPRTLRDEFMMGKARELFLGNLDFFQPDILVRCDGIDEVETHNVDCPSVTLDDIANNIREEQRPGVGIGITEILHDYYEKEEKFLRKNKTNYILPEYGLYHRCFLKAIFGDFPQEMSTDVSEEIVEVFEVEKKSVTIANYLDQFREDNFNIHDLTSYKIHMDYTRDVPTERFVIYYLDPSSFIDLVSYVNLKAAGYEVLPIAKQVSKSARTKKLCLDFINKYSWKHPKYPKNKTPVTLQKSPSVDRQEINNFYRFLSPAKFEDDDYPRCIVREWLPQFWSRFHQERGDVSCAPLTVEKKEEEVPLREGRAVGVEALFPDFVSGSMLATGEARYAIDVGISIYGSKDFDAGVIPSGSDEVARSCRMFNKREWLIKPSGITYFSRYKSKIRFDAPKAEDLFLSWLKAHGWEAEISDAGKVAYQMLRNIGGPWRVSMMKSRNFVEYFSGKLFSNDKSVKSGAFIHHVAKKIYDELGIFWGENEFIKALIDSKIVQLGTTLQCDVCSRRSWHSINDLDYLVKCPHCLSDFEIPTHIPRKIEWSYKTIGPFAARGRASGAYCVLLTSHFFEHEFRSSSTTTTVLSFKAIKEDEELEADLGLFYREGAFFNRTLETVFCECKTFNRFCKDDVDKMSKIAKAFPGAMLVFATLNDELNDDEKALISPLVKSCNKYHERDRPLNPVMVLTANELFSHARPPYAWENLGGKYEQFAKQSQIHSLLDICLATQQLYLDLGPWYKDWEAVWVKKRMKSAPNRKITKKP